jgi:hypothetical protein
MFINHLNDVTFLEKKFLNMVYYNKSYVRSDLLDSKELKLLDNNRGLNIIPINKTNPYVFNNSKTLDGLSIPSKEVIFKNNLNLFLNFKKDSIFFSKNQLDNLKPLVKILPILSKTKRIFKKVILLNPTKGGFNCYCSGFFGFIPLKHAIFSFKKLSDKVAKKASEKIINKSLLSTLKFFTFNVNKVKNFIFHLKFFIGSISLHINYKKNNFSNLKRRNKVYFNTLSVVFLAFKKREKELMK